MWSSLGASDRDGPVLHKTFMTLTVPVFLGLSISLQGATAHAADAAPAQGSGIDAWIPSLRSLTSAVCVRALVLFPSVSVWRHPCTSPVIAALRPHADDIVINYSSHSFRRMRLRHRRRSRFWSSASRPSVQSCTGYDGIAVCSRLTAMPLRRMRTTVRVGVSDDNMCTVALSSVGML